MSTTLDVLAKQLVIEIHGDKPPNDREFADEYMAIERVFKPHLEHIDKVIQEQLAEISKLRVSKDKWLRMRQAVRTLNKSMREKRYQVVRQRAILLNKMVEDITWTAGQLLGTTQSFTWFRMTKEEYYQYRNVKAIQAAADRLAEELGVCTNPKEPSVVKALTDYFKAKALP